MCSCHLLQFFNSHIQDKEGGEMMVNMQKWIVNINKPIKKNCLNQPILLEIENTVIGKKIGISQFLNPLGPRLKVSKIGPKK